MWYLTWIIAIIQQSTVYGSMACIILHVSVTMRNPEKGTILNPISVCFISRCCCFFKRKKKKSGRQKWLSVTTGLGGVVQCASNSADGEVGTREVGKRGKGSATANKDTSADPEKEAITLLRVGSRSASRDSVLHTTVTMTVTPTPPPLSNWTISQPAIHNCVLLLLLVKLLML